LQYDTSYQGIDAGRENLRCALKAPEHYTALAEYRKKIEHDLTIFEHKRKREKGEPASQTRRHDFRSNLN